jgi:hypothetical protein
MYCRGLNRGKDGPDHLYQVETQELVLRAQGPGEHIHRSILDMVVVTLVELDRSCVSILIIYVDCAVE